MKQLGPFNDKEFLWWVVLLREAFDYVGHGSTMSVLRFRQQAWHETEFGPGGMAGIALFFPWVTTESLQECVRESLEYLAW